jgi:ribonucleoside-diphosphate reductase beta chain
MATESQTQLQLDRDDRSFRYYRNAAERHWDPGDVDISADAEALANADPRVLENLYVSLAKFGAGEQAVTEDLSPLAQVLESVEDQMFVTTQLYEEAKHTDFFDRYWREVVHPAEEELGLPRSSPLDPEWFDDAYDDLFDRNEAAMDRLLTDDTPANRARAYCHYHLIIEGVLAQTGYYGLSKVYSGDFADQGLPHLPGLVEGLTLIRQDEGRHVGFGMAKLKELVHDEDVSPGLIEDVTDELLLLVNDTVTPEEGEEPDEDMQVLEENELPEYAMEKHAQRLGQIRDRDQAIPDVDELTRIES